MAAGLSANSIPLLNSQLSESIGLTLSQGITIILTALVCGFLVRKLYLNFTLTYSSPRSFGNTLAMVLLSVSALIAVVKSSLALSLGLVGALSVIRFRTAVKEPFTLSFILWSVCLGISIGAEQYIFAVLILAAGSLIIFTLFRKSVSLPFRKSGKSINHFASDTMMLSSEQPASIYKAFERLSEFVSCFNVKSISSSADATSAVVLLNINTIKDLEKLTTVLKDECKISAISFYNSANE